VCGDIERERSEKEEKKEKGEKGLKSRKRLKRRKRKSEKAVHHSLIHVLILIPFDQHVSLSSHLPTVLNTFQFVSFSFSFLSLFANK